MTSHATPFAILSTLITLATASEQAMGQAPKLREPDVILKGHADAMVFLPDGKQMVSCSQDGTIKFWDTKTWKAVKTHDTKVAHRGLNLSPDGTVLLTHADSSLWAIDIKSQQISVLFEENVGGRVLNAAFSGDSKQILVARERGRLQYWALNRDKGAISTKLAFEEQLDRDMIGFFGFVDDGKSLVIAGSERKNTSIVCSAKKIIAWDIEGKKAKRNFQVPEGIGLGNVICRVVGEDKFLFMSPGSVVRVFDITKNQELPSIKTEAGPELRSIWAVELSPDKKNLAVAEFISFDKQQGLVRVIDLETRRVKARLNCTHVPARLAFSPDGTTLACGSSSVIQIYYLKSPKAGE